MKILLVNYRYFVSGGPERYMFNFIELMESKGHEIIPFSIKNRQNKISKYEKYFLSPLSEKEEVYFKEYKSNPLLFIKAFFRQVFSFEAFIKIYRIIKDTDPDIIYILQYQNKISFSIILASKIFKKPIIQRISDFGHICTNAFLYRFKERKICELCLDGSKVNALKYKCYNDSFMLSLIKVFSLKLQEIFNIHKKIDSFIFPSRYTSEKFIKYGIERNKINHIPTFWKDGLSNSLEIEYSNYALYIGRIDPDKGIETLIKAFNKTTYKLKIIGFSSYGEYIAQMKELASMNSNIEFLGKQDFTIIKKYLRECLFTIIPSEWYDNMPNTFLESVSFSKAVIVSDIGSLSELVNDGINGLKFKCKDEYDLGEKITYMFENRNKAINMGIKAKEDAIQKYSSEKHYNSIISLFESQLVNPS